MSKYLKPEDDGLPMRPSGGWAAAKLDYLARYINTFETSMRAKWPQRHYIDLMAGPGKNKVRGSEQVLLGSPLLALTTKFPFTRYYFVESSEANVAALQERCAALPNTADVKIKMGDCNVLVHEIVADVQQAGASLNLAFLDPEGFELHWATVAKLASVRKMDLIINYPQGGFNRFARQSLQKQEKTAIDDFFGDYQWRDIFRAQQHGTTSKGLHRQLIDLYKRKLNQMGYVEVMGGDEILQTVEPLMRNSRQAPLYRLLFASKHQLGLNFWKEVTARDMYGQRSFSF